VAFRIVGQEDRTWHGGYVNDETEKLIIQRAQMAIRVNGLLRRLRFGTDQEGIRITMTDNRKEITMSYVEVESTEIKETRICCKDTTRPVLERLGFKSQYHIVDIAGRRKVSGQ
jgi:hypothetical protein